MGLCASSAKVLVVSEDEFLKHPSAAAQLVSSVENTHSPPHAPKHPPGRSGEGGADPDNGLGAGGRRAPRRRKPTLIKAAKDGDTDTVEALLGEGAAVDEPGMWGSTPLLCACQYRHSAVAMRLLAAGADAGVVNERGCTPLLHAAMEGLADVAAALLRAGANAHPGRAVAYNRVTDGNQFTTPLHAAACNGHVGIAELLLDAGVPVDTVDRPDPQNAAQDAAESCRYGTPLLEAAGQGATSVAALLLKRGANPNAADTAGATPLLLACTRGSAPLGLLLLDHGADAGAQAPTGATPLLAAARRKSDSLIAAIASHRPPNIDAQDRRGRTALMLAAEAGLARAVRSLLEAGAKVTVRDSGGATAAQLAERMGHAAVAEELRKAEVEPIRADGPDETKEKEHAKGAEG